MQWRVRGGGGGGRERIFIHVHMVQQIVRIVSRLETTRANILTIPIYHKYNLKDFFAVISLTMVNVARLLYTTLTKIQADIPKPEFFSA